MVATFFGQREIAQLLRANGAEPLERDHRAGDPVVPPAADGEGGVRRADRTQNVLVAFEAVLL
jgi:hypothetical protein